METVVPVGLSKEQLAELYKAIGEKKKQPVADQIPVSLEGKVRTLDSRLHKEAPTLKRDQLLYLTACAIEALESK